MAKMTVDEAQRLRAQLTEGKKRRFYRPFEAGMSGWRWYHRFLREYPGMIWQVEADCYTAIGRFLVWC